MINQKKLLKTLIFACGILFWTYAVPVKAQFETRIPIGTIAKPAKSSASRPPRNNRPARDTVKTVVNTVIKERVVTKQPSSLTVGTNPERWFGSNPEYRQKKIKETQPMKRE